MIDLSQQKFVPNPAIYLRFSHEHPSDDMCNTDEFI